MESESRSSRKKTYSDSSDRSKRRKTQGIREQVPVDELTFAAEMSQRAAGNVEASKLMRKITSPTRAKKLNEALINSEKNVIKKLTPSEALSILIDANLTRHQYELIQGATPSLYPCYSRVKKAKSECYPKEETITVNETLMEISLQGLLDHTASRLCKYLEEVLVQFSDKDHKNLELLTKWGCDGSQQARYNQKFTNDSDCDAHIFQSSLVPLRLISNVNGLKKIVWQNPVPSSPRYCRPIRIRFIRETSEVINEEINHMEGQAEKLNKTVVQLSEKIEAHIKHHLMPTMVDGKVCNAATQNTYTLRCYICGETSKKFNDLTVIGEVNPDSLKFGLSVLHARIRIFENLIHLSYRLRIDPPVWQVREERDKKIVSDTKALIQKKFKDEMGLLVDMVKVGFGTTNDGNTSRKIFANPEKSAEITSLDFNLIYRLKVILEVISSGYCVNVEKFSEYSFETAKLYVSLYGWCPMTPTLHKVLIHGLTLISHALLPIGQLGEEAAEARNKSFRTFRQSFARKFSTEDCNRDGLNRLLLTSDPLVTSSRSKLRRPKLNFSKEAIELSQPEQLLSEELMAESDDFENCAMEEDDISD